jgi:hypothetical protein
MHTRCLGGRLREAYGVFREEALNIAPDYSPVSVCTDGWLSARKAWESLFPEILIILCFLHLYIKVRDGPKKKFREFFTETASRLWNCFRAPTKASFSQRVRRLCEWGEKISLPSFIMTKFDKLRHNLASYAGAYDYPAAHRTSNMIDRLMQRTDGPPSVCRPIFSRDDPQRGTGYQGMGADPELRAFQSADRHRTRGIAEPRAAERFLLL